MESVVEHQIESEVAGPPPRPARLSWRTQVLLALAGALAVLLLLGGARALLEAMRLGWVAAAGRTVAAHITQIGTEPSAAPGLRDIPTGLWYEYTDPFTGSPVRLFARIGPDPARDAGSPVGGIGSQGAGSSARRSAPPILRVGDRLPLRVAYWRGRPLEYLWTSPPYGKGIFLALCGLVVMGVSLHLIRTLACWRRDRVRLLGHGVASTGTIIHKHADVGDTPRYYLRYGYATVKAGETLEHEEQVSREQWGRFEIGQPVTVLYDPVQPAQAGLYSLIKS